MRRSTMAKGGYFCFALVFLATTQLSPAKDKDKGKHRALFTAVWHLLRREGVPAGGGQRPCRAHL